MNIQPIKIIFMMKHPIPLKPHRNHLLFSCKPYAIESKGSLLPVGAWRYIRNFHVRPAGGAYRTTNHASLFDWRHPIVIQEYHAAFGET